MRKIAATLLRWVGRILIMIMKLLLLLLGSRIPTSEQEGNHTNTLVRRESQNRMNEFINIIGHELKTPLTSIKGNIQLTGRRLENGLETETTQTEETKQLLSEARGLLERTDQQISRLTRLVNSLLESSRIYANTMDLLFELCEMNKLIPEVMQNPQPLPPTRTVLVMMPEKKTILVMADSTRVKQVISQYLSNAHKYSEIEQPIEVRLHEDGSMAHVSVRDKGPGIPFEEQKNIWERFYRVPGIEVRNGSERGLGLGLHICKTIVEQHHGQVGVQSRPGDGSTFWFTLPLFKNHLSHLESLTTP